MAVTPQQSADALFGMPYEQIVGFIREHDRLIREAEREKVAQFMLARSIATGHGDTIEALLSELGGHLDRLT